MATNMQQAKPSLPEDEERTTALGLLRYAYEYIDAARIVDDAKVDDPEFMHLSPVPAYFLAFHGIELSLKAFLRHKGMTARELRGKTYGHDVLACLRKAKEMGLGAVYKLTPEDDEALRLLFAMNHHQGLRYIKTGVKQYPYWSIVEPFAVKLHQSVARVLKGRTFDNVAYP
jgi:hypothetical protein